MRILGGECEGELIELIWWRLVLRERLWRSVRLLRPFDVFGVVPWGIDSSLDAVVEKNARGIFDVPPIT